MFNMNICECGCGQLCNNRFILGHHRRGTISSEDANKKRRATLLKYWSNPENRAEHSRIMQASWDNDADRKQYYSEMRTGKPSGAKGLPPTEAQLLYWASLKETMKGSGNHFYGKKHSEKSRKQMSISKLECLKRKPELLEAMRLRMIGKKIHLGYKNTSETKQKMKIAKLGKPNEYLRRAWQNQEFRDQVIPKMLYIQSPNRMELRLLALLNSGNFGNWNFVGNGKLIVNGKCPDFWDGGSKLIEFFGRKWHKTEDEEKRIELFSEANYRCLVIWSEEMKDYSTLSIKIANFSNPDSESV